MNPQPTIYSTATALRGQDNAAAGRRQLGLEIAATIKIGKNRAGYVVPSQSGTGSYLVNGVNRNCQIPGKERDCSGPSLEGQIAQLDGWQRP